MSKIYEKNMSYLEKGFLGFYRQAEKITQKWETEVIESREPGYFFLTYQGNNSKRYLLNSRFNPKQEAMLWAGKQNLQDASHVLLFGLGLGYHAEALLTLFPNITLFVYEPEASIFRATLFERDWSVFPWTKIKYLALDSEGKHMSSFLTDVIALVKPGWEMVASPAYTQCFAELFHEFVSVWTQLTKNYIQTMRLNFVFERNWTLNALRNAIHLLDCKCIFTYRPSFEGRNVVMVASGPSLEKAIPFLKGVLKNRKALIVAVGSSYNRLLKEGIQPHFLASYDPKHNNYEVMKAGLNSGIPLIFGTTINADIIRDYRGSKAYFVLSQDTVYKFFHGSQAEEEMISDAPSIAVVMMELLGKLGVKQVVLVGQDLAYSEKQIYASGTSNLCLDGKTKPEDIEKSMKITANNSEIVYTNDLFNSMREGIEKTIAENNFSQVINTAEYGAKIKGTIYKTYFQVTELLQDEEEVYPIIFEQHSSGFSARMLKKNAKRAFEQLKANHIKFEHCLKRFLNSGEKEDTSLMEKRYDEIDKALVHFTSTAGYSEFIAPTVRNSIHFLKKSFVDLPNMTLEERMSFVKKQLVPYSEAVKLTILQLFAVYEEWKNKEESTNL